MNTLQVAFEAAYKGLNPEQKRAVDTIEGPVMVVAGPGTGKTQVLALRIAHILQTTDTPPSGILCLTFTRAGVSAMRERLVRYIGTRASEVRITTFHSYATSLVEKNFALLDFEDVPKLLDDQGTIVLIDELLERTTWEYLRPRGNGVKYFSDLRSLISLLKRERLTAERFLSEVERDIIRIEENPESISSRGATKGQLKKEALKSIEGLKRTKEVVTFYNHYEFLKRDRGLMDYDDVLEYAVTLVEFSDDIRAEIRENALYVHVDEHQDSSGVQNSFLEAVWKETEQPNIFVVGDDRQLIYGFGGASLTYFEQFKTTFGKACFITLVQNYRSTKPILDLADEMQKSSLTNELLQSNTPELHPVVLSEYNYERDEIIAAGLFFKSQLEKGILLEDCALLVPKNKQVRSAVQILASLGLPTRSSTTVSLFSIPETAMFRRALSVVTDPFSADAIALTLFDTTSSIPPLVAHRFIHEHGTYKLSLDVLNAETGNLELFSEQDSVRLWGKKLASWVSISEQTPLELLVQIIGNELLIDTAPDHTTLLRRVEVVRTMIHLVTAFIDTAATPTLKGFLNYITRLEQYGHTLQVAVLESAQGISVLTLHGSKGLEYNSVWIAHMNESVLMSSKRQGFALPESIEARIEARSEAVARREVYVAITRAKQYCVISYARKNLTGAEQTLATVVATIPEEYFSKKDASTTEAELLSHSANIYVQHTPLPFGGLNESVVEELTAFVRDTYTKTKVSVTLLNNFFECQWKWYFRNILKLPETKTESLWFGSAVHGVIESVLKKLIPVEKNAIAARITEVLAKEGVSNEYIVARMVAGGVPLVEEWAGLYLTTIAVDHSAERSLSYHDVAFPHLQFYGKIDLTERFGDGTIIVTDFKTGSPKTSGVIEKHDEEGRLSSYIRQLAMYSYLLQGTEKGKEVRASRLLFLEADPQDKNKLYSIHIDTETIDLLKRDIKDYDTMVQTGEWINRVCTATPFNGGECEYCIRAKALYGV